MTAEGGERKESVVTARSFFTRHSSLAFVLGAVAVAGYAPFYLFPLPVLVLAGLLYFWSQAPTAGAAALTGFAFGLGLFRFGVSWMIDITQPQS